MKTQMMSQLEVQGHYLMFMKEAMLLFFSLQNLKRQKDDKWIEPMKEELRMIEKNDTWELVDRPQHRNVIGVKWI